MRKRMEIKSIPGTRDNWVGRYANRLDYRIHLDDKNPYSPQLAIQVSPDGWIEEKDTEAQREKRLRPVDVLGIAIVSGVASLFLGALVATLILLLFEGDQASLTNPGSVMPAYMIGIGVSFVILFAKFVTDERKRLKAPSADYKEIYWKPKWSTIASVFVPKKVDDNGKPIGETCGITDHDFMRKVSLKITSGLKSSSTLHSIIEASVPSMTAKEDRGARALNPGPLMIAIDPYMARIPIDIEVSPEVRKSLEDSLSRLVNDAVKQENIGEETHRWQDKMTADHIRDLGDVGVKKFTGKPDTDVK